MRLHFLPASSQPLTTRALLPVFFALLVAHAAEPPSESHAADSTGAKTNVIVIFTDDQGYADLGCQGVVQDVRTPHLDRLAREGIRCTAGYVTAPQCTPSRVGLLTGRYQQRL